MDHIVVERQSGPAPNSRAAALHARTLESLAAVGVADELVAAGRPGRAFAARDGDRVLLQTICRSRCAVRSTRSPQLTPAARRASAGSLRYPCLVGWKAPWGSAVMISRPSCSRMFSLVPAFQPSAAVTWRSASRPRWSTTTIRHTTFASRGGRATGTAIRGRGCPMARTDASDAFSGVVSGTIGRM
ncbi:FAD-dependent monooxygenase [Lentzea sp.]|uniref:FAD-dependent monooxygenase n=1 Tax=Lentzea sp. TaxID=56099 RepID=UPI0039C9749B